jgi:type I restriction enzyme, S subunit
MNNKLERELEKALHIGENDLPQIPKSWIYVKLSAVSNRIGGGTPSRKSPEYFIGDIPWITVADIPKDSKRPFTISNSRERITEKAIAESSAKLIPTRSVVVSTRVSVGKVGINDKPICTNQDFSSFSFYKIDSRFAAYFLFTVAEALNRKAIGSTIKGIKTKDLDDLRFPLPPLLEQKRIVEKLDYSFDIIDKIEKDLAKVKELLTKRHEALLKKAFRGELVHQETNNDSVNQLSEIAKEDTPYQLPKNWVWVYMKDVIDLISGSHIKSDLYSDNPSDGIPYFTGPSDFLGETTNATKFSKSGTSKCNKGDILITVKGSGLGTVAIANTDAYIGRQLMAIRPKEMLSPKYLFYWSKYSQKDIKRLATGIAIPGISRNDILGMVLPLPPISEQDRIVNRLENEFDKQREILETIKKSEEKLKKMRQSLLQKAFRGELVEQRPEEGTGLDLLKEIIEEKLKKSKIK